MHDHAGKARSETLSIRIGDWLLDPTLNLIEREGEKVHLEPKSVAVLQLLASRQGEPITRKELLDAVWRNVVVSDDALTQVIIKLRKAFGDNSRKPLFIQTIPKRGYRLVAPVEVIIQPPVPQPHPILPSRGRLLVITTLLLSAFYLATLLTITDDDLVERATDNAAVPEPMSIAVLPFEAGAAVSGDDEEMQQAFARGIASDLATDLSKISALRIISMPLSSPEKPPARYLVTGQVLQANGRLKLYISLIDSETGHHIWSDRYDRQLDEIFDMQQTMSMEIVSQLSVTVSEAEKERLAKRYTHNLSAYEAFLRGQTELLRREQDANGKARNQYQQAIEKDPAFARAYAGLALSYAAEFRNQWVEDGGRALQKAEEMATTAQQIDPNIPEVYWVLGYVDAQNRKHQRALGTLEQAIDLDLSYADAYALMGGINTYIGKPDKTLHLLRKAMRLRPDAGYLYYLLLGRAYFFLGDNEQAMINLQESLRRNSEGLEARIYLAATAVASNNTDIAEWEHAEIKSLVPEFQLSRWLATYPMTDPGQIAYLTKKLKTLGF